MTEVTDAAKKAADEKALHDKRIAEEKKAADDAKVAYESARKEAYDKTKKQEEFSTKLEEDHAKKLQAKKERKEQIGFELAAILKEYGNLSDVPINHVFWSLQNELRSL
mgnify:CR=1 FL=1